MKNNQTPIKKNQKGGKREGAGRKKGAKNKATVEKEMFAAAVTRKAVESGATPLEVMLDNMRFAMEEAGLIIAKMNGEPKPSSDDFKQLLRLRAMAQSFATDAAPYVHPKLANVQHVGDPDKPIEGRTRIEIVFVGAESDADRVSG